MWLLSSTDDVGNLYRAEAFGFRGDVWTTERVAQMILHVFGVSYHPAHCSRLLRRVKYSLQKPIQKATQRDEAAFYLLPMAVRTYAPMGKTPILKVKLTRDHLSAIGALTPEGKIVMQTQIHSYKGPDVVR